MGSSLSPAFASLFGQDVAGRLLTRFLQSDRLPPAFLFAGPDGVGKRHAARLFARALSCLDKTACGRCEACRANEFGEGLREIDVVALVGDESIRNKAVAFRAEIFSHGVAHRLARFVVIIDAADRLNDTMQAALLKAIEEPPPRTHYLLVSAAAGELTATIRSRCVGVRFRPLVAAAIEKILAHAAMAAPPNLEELVTMSGGSWSRCRRLMERGLDGEALLRIFAEAAFSGRRHDLAGEFDWLVPAAVALRPSWREPLLAFASAIAANAHIDLASTVLRHRLAALGAR